MRRIELGEELRQREETARRSGRNWRRFHSSEFDAAGDDEVMPALLNGAPATS